MSRFQKIFLRNPLNGATHVAGFGKHPAWDDHIDDIGMATETLVLAKQLLYSEGIASQLASGAWDQIEKSHHTIEFAHRFVWSRDEQSIVGAIWASADRKGRTRFPMAACIQADRNGPAATRTFLNAIEQLCSSCKAAQTKEQVRNSFERARAEASNQMFLSSGFYSSEPNTKVREDQTLPALVALSVGLNARGGRGSGKGGQSKYFRLPTISKEVIENLEFWSVYLARQHNLDLPYLIIAPVAKSWIDLIVGEPVSNDFYCLKADETTVPVVSAKVEDALTRRLEAEARDYLQKPGIVPSPIRQTRRSWWSKFLGQ